MLPTGEDLAIIGATPLFSGLTGEHAAPILRNTSVRSFDEDTLLFSAGDPADRFYVALKGSVRLFALTPDGDEAIIEIVGAGHTFAEAAIFGLAWYPVNGEAMAGARVAAVSVAPLLETLRTDSTLATHMLSSLYRWQLHLLAEIRRLKGQSPAQRLAWFLVSLAEGAERTAHVRLPYRKSILAGRIGITPESLSRALARLADLGVESKGDEVVLHDIPALRQFCRG